MAGTLYLVATPIGNLRDMTDRARETLASVDVVAAEDTRRTGRLLKHFGIDAPLVSFFEGNEAKRTAELVAALGRGEDVAVVSDAGTPAVSDPGHRLVAACLDAGIDVRAVPGPSAVIAALVVSGLPTDRFVFEGFVPRKSGERRVRLESLAHDPRTVVLFESPLRVATLLRDALVVLGDRRVAVVRELTKRHEEVIRGRIAEVLASIGDHDLKGEVVVVLEGASEPPEPPPTPELAAEAMVLVAAGTKRRTAAAQVAGRYGVSANEVYRAMLADRD